METRKLLHTQAERAAVEELIERRLRLGSALEDNERARSAGSPCAVPKTDVAKLVRDVRDALAHARSSA